VEHPLKRLTVNTVLTRREFAALAGASLLARPAQAQSDSVVMRAIPSSGELVPAVGLGTARIFDNANEPTRNKAAAVVQALVANGGRIIDTASTYGDAEIVMGAEIAAANLRDKIFIATKLESPDPSELKRSLSRLKTAKVDLLQLHNVEKQNQSLGRFREWKSQGICRYVGVTSTYHRDFPVVESVLRREKPDFVQIDYSLDVREAEKRILPQAADVKAGVLTAIPFGNGRLFRAVRGQTIPDWASEFASSWAQFFLKYLLADTRVTAVIPGTGDPKHLIDNLGAMRGRLPDAKDRAKMISFIEAL
jgi:aryl-alcohol dehydrogenase-like predicted oxidoreductase